MSVCAFQFNGLICFFVRRFGLVNLKKKEQNRILMIDSSLMLHKKNCQIENRFRFYVYVLVQQKKLNENTKLLTRNLIDVNNRRH